MVVLFPEIEEDDPEEDDGVKELHEHPAKVVTREEWGAAEPLEKERIRDFPVPYVVCMHTMTRACNGKEDCIRAVKEIQKTHMDQGEPDIIYNYLLDMEGHIYIGRGPTTVSMLYPETDKKLSKANKKSLSIGLIGSGGIEPPEVMIQGGASLTCLLFEGRYIDETINFVWYQIPTAGHHEKESNEEEDPVHAHIEAINRASMGEELPFSF